MSSQSLQKGDKFMRVDSCVPWVGVVEQQFTGDIYSVSRPDNPSELITAHQLEKLWQLPGDFKLENGLDHSECEKPLSVQHWDEHVADLKKRTVEEGGLVETNSRSRACANKQQCRLCEHGDVTYPRPKWAIRCAHDACRVASGEQKKIQGDRYFLFENRATYQRFYVCQKHETQIDKDIKDGVESPICGRAVNFADYKRKKINKKDRLEDWLKCSRCDHSVHKVCALYNNPENSLASRNIENYVCPMCTKVEGKESIKELAVPLAEGLPRTILSESVAGDLFGYIDEVHEKGFHKKLDLTVRQVSSFNKVCCLSPGTKRLFDHLGIGFPPGGFKCRSKCILLFQRIQGVDVLLFALYVYEHKGDTCEIDSNKGTVSISFLDSFKYMMVPSGEKYKTLRSLTYSGVVLAYLRYAQTKGLTSCHIWAYPPEIGKDYILNAKANPRPISEEFLVLFYQRIGLDAKNRGIIKEITNMHDKFFKTRKADKLPYHYGDYVSYELDRLVKDLDGRQKTVRSMDDVVDALGEDMEKSKRTLFVFFFNTSSRHEGRVGPSRPSNLIDDDEEEISCIADDREAFLEFQDDHKLSFNMVRTAKRSSLVILSNLHDDITLKNADRCMLCGHALEAMRYHSSEMNEDLCVECHTTKAPLPASDFKLKAVYPAQIDTTKRKDCARKLQKWGELLELASATECGGASRNQKLRDMCLYRSEFELHCRTLGGAPCQKHSPCRWIWYLIRRHRRNCKNSNCRVPMCAGYRALVQAQYPGRGKDLEDSDADSDSNAESNRSLASSTDGGSPQF